MVLEVEARPLSCNIKTPLSLTFPVISHFRWWIDICLLYYYQKSTQMSGWIDDQVKKKRKCRHKCINIRNICSNWLTSSHTKTFIIHICKFSSKTNNVTSYLLYICFLSIATFYYNWFLWDINDYNTLVAEERFKE